MTYIVTRQCQRLRPHEVKSSQSGRRDGRQASAHPPRTWQPSPKEPVHWSLNHEAEKTRLAVRYGEEAKLRGPSWSRPRSRFFDSVGLPPVLTARRRVLVRQLEHQRTTLRPSTSAMPSSSLGSGEATAQPWALRASTAHLTSPTEVARPPAQIGFCRTRTLVEARAVSATVTRPEREEGAVAIRRHFRNRASLAGPSCGDEAR